MHLLEHRALTHVDRLKGRFRSFLLASFQNYLANELQRMRSQKRGGNNQFISLDWEEGETRYRLEPADYLTAEKIYEARWAMTLLHNVMEQLQKQYVAQGKGAIFAELQVFVRFGEESRIPSYEEVAKRMGIGVPAVKTLIHRLRKQYTTILREEVGQNSFRSGRYRCGDSLPLRCADCGGRENCSVRIPGVSLRSISANLLQ